MVGVKRSEVHNVWGKLKLMANSQQNKEIPAPHPGMKLGLTALMLLMAAGPWLPPPWLWGLNHTAWLPALVRIVLPLFGLLMIWTPAGPAFGNWLVTRLAPQLPGRPWVVYGLVPVLGAAVFWMLRDHTHMLGDGQTLAVMITGDHLFHGFDFMTYHLLARLYQGIGGGGEIAAFQVTAVVSCLSGAAYLATAGWAARRLSDHPSSRLLLYCLLVCGTPLLLFFGYMEVYAPLSVAMLVFVTLFILYRENRGSLLAISVSWSFGLFFHLNALFLAPILVLALLRPPPENTAGSLRRLGTLIWPPVTALILAGVIHAAAGFDLAGFKEDFSHIGQGNGILVGLAGPEGFFTWRHLKDTVNLLLLLAPIPILLLATNLRSTTGKAGGSGPGTDLFLGSAWLVLVMALVHLKLGTVRDWDLFAPFMGLLALAGWYAATGGGMQNRFLNALLGPVTACALVLALPWLMVNVGAARSLARLEAVASDMPPYALGLLHEQFAYHHQTAGNPEEVIRHYRLCGEVCPNHARFHAIYGTHMLNEGHLGEAAAAYDRAVAADSTFVYGLKMGAIARVMNGDFAGALKPARLLEARGQQDPEAAAAHGMAAQQLGLRDEAEAAYLDGFARDPSRLDLLERAAGIQLLERKFTDAETNFRKVTAGRPDYGQGHLGLAEAIWQDYLAHGESRTVETNRARLRETFALIKKVMTLKSTDPNGVEGLQSWHDQVGSSLADPTGN